MLRLKTIEDFLEAIQNIISKKGYVKNKDISKELNVKPGNITKTLKELHNEGMIEYEKREKIIITEKGKKIANSVKTTHEIVKKFLSFIFVSEQISEKDACEIEHVLSDETKRQLTIFVNFLDENEDIREKFKNFYGERYEYNEIKYNEKYKTKSCLIDLTEKEKGKIIGFNDICEKERYTLENIGVNIGKEFEVVAKQPYGPIIIKINENEIAIGRGKAKKIYVEKI